MFINPFSFFHWQIPTHRVQQDTWLDTELKDANAHNCKHIVIFQHIPWFLESPSEENGYFNIETTTRKKMMDKFKAAGQRTY